MPNFLDIPVELRLKVYRSCFILERPIHYCRKRGQITRVVASSQLLATCKQVYQEGAGVLYGQNCIAVEGNLGAAHIFGEAIGKECATFVKDLKITCNYMTYWRNSVSTFGLYPNLKNLCIDLGIEWNKDPPVCLETGSFVQSNYNLSLNTFTSPLLPIELPPFPRLLLSRIIAEDRLEIQVAVGFQAHHRSEVRVDRYRVVPLAPKRKVSAIGMKYDLVYLYSTRG